MKHLVFHISEKLSSLSADKKITKLTLHKVVTFQSQMRTSKTLLKAFYLLVSIEKVVSA